jgi:hypothetical protein
LLPLHCYGIPRLITQHIQTIEKLLLLSRTAERTVPDQADLETLRSAVDYELNITVLSETFDASIIRPYLRSVQLRRHRLFSNFNTLVLVNQHRGQGGGQRRRQTLTCHSLQRDMVR